MSGALFREREKRTEKSPDYRGRIMVAGTFYKLAGWLRETKDGQKYLSLAVSTAAGSTQQPQEDDLPF